MYGIVLLLRVFLELVALPRSHGPVGKLRWLLWISDRPNTPMVVISGLHFHDSGYMTVLDVVDSP